MPSIETIIEPMTMKPIRNSARRQTEEKALPANARWVTPEELREVLPVVLEENKEALKALKDR